MGEKKLEDRAQRIAVSQEGNLCGPLCPVPAVGGDGQPVEVYEFEGVLLSRQPPTPVRWCKVGISGRASAACAHRCSTCTGGSHQCPMCFYRYCDRHYEGHFKFLYVPTDTWRTFVTNLRQAVTEIVESGKRRTPIKIPKPEVHAAEALED